MRRQRMTGAFQKPTANLANLRSLPMSLLKKYVTPYIGTAVVVGVVLILLTQLQKNATARKFTSYFGYTG